MSSPARATPPPGKNELAVAALLAKRLPDGTAAVDTPASAGDDARTQPSAVIDTSSGPVQGLTQGEDTRFLGIPFAAPPIGELRWRPPQAVSRSAQTIQATHFQNTCAQAQRGVFASPSTTEDCLYLNVFVSRTDTSHLPVMVWLHGGGLFSGESSDYDGSKLAHDGHVVVVTLNYRVGALGFLSHPALNAEGHPYANYGLMDQQFALRWIKRNIARFGGDPDNVTIFGQSGGATNVLANLVSPTAAGLFQRAISQSGTRIAPYSQVQAVRNGTDFATAAGCPDQSAACLRALTVEQVLKSQGKIVSFLSTRFPVVDGTVVTLNAADAFESGQFNRVPIMNGLVRDEQAFFMPEMNTGVARTSADYDRLLTSFGEQHATALRSRYPLANYESPSLAEIALEQDLKVCTARYLDRNWARFVPVFAYQFNDRTAPSYFKPVSFPMRAYHTAELQYLFPLFHGGQGMPHPLDAAQQKLSDQMVAYWTRFAHDGAPSPAQAGVTTAAWPRYSARSDDVQSLDLPAASTLSAYGKASNCGLWDGLVLAD
jgi:para-nitrobenzyl esterase